MNVGIFLIVLLFCSALIGRSLQEDNLSDTYDGLEICGEYPIEVTCQPYVNVLASNSELR